MKKTSDYILYILIPPLAFMKYINLEKINKEKALMYLRLGSVIPTILVMSLIVPSFMSYLSNYFYILRPEIVYNLAVSLDIIIVALFFKNLNVAYLLYITLTIIVLFYPYYEKQLSTFLR